MSKYYINRVCALENELKLMRLKYEGNNPSNYLAKLVVQKRYSFHLFPCDPILLDIFRLLRVNSLARHNLVHRGSDGESGGESDGTSSSSQIIQDLPPLPKSGKEVKKIIQAND